MPLITRRSSTRVRPGLPRGKCLLTSDQASSDSQNSRTTAASLRGIPFQKRKRKSAQSVVRGPYLEDKRTPGAPAALRSNVVGL